MRTKQHIIDSRSVKRVLNLLPDHWVVRELTERDYGIDLFIEIFENKCENGGQDRFESIGATFHVQVKGTTSKLEPKKDGTETISYSFGKNSLLYSERFSTPFLLFRVDVSSESAPSYFVWIQRYIQDVLDLETPSWRTCSQESFTINIPLHNDISSNFEKIEKIALRPKLLEETIEFSMTYFHLSSQLNAVSLGCFNLDEEALDYMVLLARRINNLKVIFKYNNCCISKSCAEDLLLFVRSLTLDTPQSQFNQSPHQYNFELLRGPLISDVDLENYLAEYNGTTVY